MSRYERLLQFIRFGLVGLSGMIVDLLTFSVLLLALSLPVARALAIWVAMTWNFVLNRRFTFDRDSWIKSIALQYFGFCAVCLLGGIVNWSTTVGLCHMSDRLRAHPTVAAMFGVVAGSLINYFACCLWIFRASPTTTTCDRG